MSIPVGKLIKRNLVTIEAGSSIEDAARLMVRENVGLLVVIHGGSMIGVVSERDVVRAIANGVDLKSPVESIATRNVVTINVNEPMHKAAELMHVNNIRHLVVVDNEGRPIGVVSVRDIVGESVRLRILAEYSAKEVSEEPIQYAD
mgnify:CR=1 FL=1